MNARLGLVLFAALSSLACGSRESRESPDTKSAIARVDGSAIDAADLAPSAGEPRSDSHRLLDRLIARKLAAAEARRRGIADQNDVRAKLDAIQRDAAAREEEVLRDALFASLRDAVTPSDEELRAHYEKTRSRYTERRLHLRRQATASEAEAKAIDEALGHDGHLDPAHAEEIGPTAIEKLPASVIPEALRLRAPGDRIAIARDGDFALVELVEILPSEPKTFEDVRPQVEASLRTLRAEEAFRAKIESLRASAKIEIDETMLRSASGDRDRADASGRINRPATSPASP